MGFEDYSNVIKNPIDLGTIKKKLEMSTNNYEFVEDIYRDI